MVPAVIDSSNTSHMHRNLNSVSVVIMQAGPMPSYSPLLPSTDDMAAVLLRQVTCLFPYVLFLCRKEEKELGLLTGSLAH